MNKNIINTSILKDVRIVLSALWAARMLSGLQGDIVRYMEPGVIEEMIARTGSWEPVTNGLLLIMSIIFFIPILMSFLSLTLKDKVNRWANRSLGIFFVLFDLVFLILMFFSLQTTAAFEVFWGIVYLVFTTLVVWYAWHWPKQEA